MEPTVQLMIAQQLLTAQKWHHVSTLPTKGLSVFAPMDSRGMEESVVAIALVSFHVLVQSAWLYIM